MSMCVRERKRGENKNKIGIIKRKKYTWINHARAQNFNVRILLTILIILLTL